VTDVFTFIEEPPHAANPSRCLRIPNGIICLAPDTVRFRVGATTHYCEPAHGYHVPLRLRRDGSVADRQWGERSKFWEHYYAWERGGRLVSGDGWAVVGGVA
jgi:hypothetical protein